MPNQDIITALGNAIEQGESLQTAMQIMINSGYNQQEVQEASKYVIQGVTPQLETKPTEQLTMPGTKPKKQSFFSKINPFKKKTPQPGQQQTLQLEQQTTPRPQQQTQLSSTPQPQEPLTIPPSQPQSPIPQLPQQPLPALKQPSQEKPQPLAKQLKKIQPPRKSYIKEIILLIILIILVGILITTIIYRDEILKFFSG